MEADSTTYDNSAKTEDNEPNLPFSICPGNYKLYKEFIASNGDQRLENLLVERLQKFGLIPSNVACPTNGPDCKLFCRSARVVDRVQWVCEGCGKKQPIRAGSFFYRLQCTIQQALQIILAWCEDADLEVASEHFGVKPKVATLIYDRLDELAIAEHQGSRLGGENSVVLAEMYPDCVNRLSPDTTDQPHVHRILMLADTNHIPTAYKLHVLRGDNKKFASNSNDNQALKCEIEEAISHAIVPNSLVVIGSNVPAVDGAISMQQLLQHCDVDMQHFLSSRVWRQALALCAAARDVCAEGVGGVGGAAGAGGAGGACAGAVQRYLRAALQRLRHADGLYRHVLTRLAGTIA